MQESALSLPENTEGWFSFTCISVFVVLMTAQVNVNGSLTEHLGGQQRQR